MSAHRDRAPHARPARATRRARAPHRRGASLLVVVATLAVLALVVATLVTGARASVRQASQARTRTALAARADLARDEAIAEVHAGAWRTLGDIGGAIALPVTATPDTVITARVGRAAWDALVVAIALRARGGVAGLDAHVARRLDIPLRTPWPMPRAPLTGVHPWARDAGAVVTGHADDGDSTRRCVERVPAAGPSERLVAAPSLAALLAHPGAQSLDPDTAPPVVQGLVVLDGGRSLERPLVVRGWLVATGALAVRAPLRVEGVLVAGGAVDTPAGGRVHVTGAAWSLDDVAGRARLGPRDTVRWAPCLVRRVRAALAVPAPIAAWDADHGG
ncbi:MAG: hypothetical protein MUF21_00820 [Gemmatimonadaceae bacterium]|jgi:hypothetical protein|nr:hypothetical protein [Gemmatimonadaceae bacterium]